MIHRTSNYIVSPSFLYLLCFFRCLLTLTSNLNLCEFHVHLDYSRGVYTGWGGLKIRLKKVVRISGWANYFLQASMGVIIHYCLTRLTFIHDHYLLKTTNIFIYLLIFFTKKIIFNFNIYFFLSFLHFLTTVGLKIAVKCLFCLFLTTAAQGRYLKATSILLNVCQNYLLKNCCQIRSGHSKFRW